MAEEDMAEEDMAEAIQKYNIFIFNVNFNFFILF